MAKSGIPGIYGFARGKVGAVVYSTSNAALSGGRKQIVRIKAENVKNPRTIAQIVQRMKIGPAQLFYAAFEKAAGSVENNPLSHSWEGVEYGSKSRMRFMQLAMAGEPKAYVPKGVKFPAPGQYQVSEGSLQSLPWRQIHVNSDVLLLGSSTTLTQANVDALAAYGVEVGDQITIMYLLSDDNGRYSAHTQRLIVGVGNKFTLNQGDLDDWRLFADGFQALNLSIACVAMIVSRGITNDAKRSTETMMIMPNYASLLSPEAYDKAIESYVTGVTYNSLNSTWYLNQGNSQAFNGQVFTQNLELAAGEGVDAKSGWFILGRQLDGNNLVYTIFTTDGTSAGTAVTDDDGSWGTNGAFTTARVVAALGAVNVRYEKMTDAIYAQISGNA